MLQQRSEFWFIIVVTREVGLAADDAVFVVIILFPCISILL